MRLPILLLLLPLGLLLGSPCAAQSADTRPPPWVGGYERMYRAGGASIDAGRLLFGELACAACHRDRSSDPLPGPDLAHVGARLQHDWITRFLADPRSVEPHTRMPDVLASLPAEEARAAADALTHFLVSLDAQGVRQVPVDGGAAARGEDLFHSVGCVACHAPRRGDERFEASSAPLPVFETKYGFDGLRELLDDPLSVRPSGRMPDMHLDAQEARDVAHYLLGAASVPGHVRYALYRGGVRELEQIDRKVPVESGLTDAVGKHVTRLKNDYSLRFETWVLVERAGNYTFHIRAQDGAQLVVGSGDARGEVIVGKPGGQSPREGEVELVLEPGAHPLRIVYHQSWISGVLELEWEGPGIERAPIPIERLRSTAEPVEPLVTITPDAALVERGRELFATVGCAACHAISGLESQVHDLAELGALGGCLAGARSESPAAYDLDGEQRAALAAWLEDRSDAPAGPAARLAHGMAALDCYACHAYAGRGGPSDERAELFTSDDPDPDDQARRPPRLDDVGDKLKLEWLAQVLDEGTAIRPSMDARMPRFGVAHVAGFAQDFREVDRGHDRPGPSTEVTLDDEARAAGRHLVGMRGWNCIACHRFQGRRSASMQRLDLATMTERVERDWFESYLPDASRYRDGTRMPAVAALERTFGEELDGDLGAQVRAVWAYLADGIEAEPPFGLDVPKNELVPDERPIVYRGKVEGAGYRAIAVAFPGGLNLAFDAQQVRLATIWKGRFLDVGQHWSGSGMGFVAPLGDEQLLLPDGPALARLSSSEEPWPLDARQAGWRFGGYVLGSDGAPTFLYSLDSIQIEDGLRPRASARASVLERQLLVTSDEAQTDLWLRIAAAPVIEGPIDLRVDGRIDGEAHAHFVVGGDLELRLGELADLARLRRAGGLVELLVPVELVDGAVRVELEYRW